MNHYELTEETREVDGRTLHRIRAKEDFANARCGKIPAGTLGGFVENVCNIADDACVSDDACVIGQAMVSDDAWVSGQAMVIGDTLVSGQAHVSGQARITVQAHVSGQARITAQAHVSGRAYVGGHAWISDRAYVSGDALISGRAWVNGHAWVSGRSRLIGRSRVSDHTWVSDDARVSGDAIVSDDACVIGDARVSGWAIIGKHGYITSTSGYLTIRPIGRRNSYTTFYKTKDHGIWVCSGCFNGSIESFRRKFTETSRKNKVAADIAEKKLKQEVKKDGDKSSGRSPNGNPSR